MLQSQHKDAALDETKAYTTRALASVSNQIHNFASNLITLFDLQLNGINELETQANSMASAIRFHAERASRREIGKLTKPKLLPNPAPKVIKPMYPERYAAKKRRTNYYSSSSSGGHRQDSIGSGGSGGSGGNSIDFTVLDEIGQAHRIYERRTNLKLSKSQAAGIYNNPSAQLIANGYAGQVAASGNSLSTGFAGQRHWMPSVKSATLRPSKSSNLSALYTNAVATSSVASGSSNIQSQQQQQSDTSGRTPAPTVRPPTPPLGSATMSRFSSLSRGSGNIVGSGSKDYRSLGLIVAPPQLPNNYQTPPLQPPQSIVQNVQNTKTTSGTINNTKQQIPNTSTTADGPKKMSIQSLEQPTQPMSTRRSPSTNPFVDDNDEESSQLPLATTGSSTDTSLVPATYIQKGL